MQVFGLMFVISFIALLTTLVVLHICKRIDKSKDDFRNKVETIVDKTKKPLTYGKSPVDEVYEAIKEHDRLSKRVCVKPDPFITNISEPHYNSLESWMKREVNGAQEKWKESIPKHKTRIKARNKRKQRNKR